MDSMLSGDLRHPAVDAALATAADVVGMEVVFIGGLTESEFAFARVHGDMPGVTEGLTLPRTDSFCHRLVSGAPSWTSDAEHDPAYADSPARQAFNITSYVGVPVRGSDGSVIGTLCGLDRSTVPIEDRVVKVLTRLVGVIEAHLAVEAEGDVVRRTPSGWRVGTESTDDLTSAMVLADLLSGDAEALPRPPRGDDAQTEEDRLRIAVTQLEHALAARVTVEQAIGVIAERQHLPPRSAFERLRKAARSRGKKVHDLARAVVASVNDASVPLPPELAGRR
jgi:hypothetical protein